MIERNGRRRSLRRPKLSAIKESSVPGGGGGGGGGGEEEEEEEILT